MKKFNHNATIKELKKEAKKLIKQEARKNLRQFYYLIKNEANMTNLMRLVSDIKSNNFKSNLYIYFNSQNVNRLKK